MFSQVVAVTALRFTVLSNVGPSVCLKIDIAGCDITGGVLNIIEKVTYKLKKISIVHLMKISHFCVFFVNLTAKLTVHFRARSFKHYRTKMQEFSDR